MSFSLEKYKGKKVHLIGIGGSMMSGIAGILLNNGVSVSGSDFRETKALTDVRKMGASVKAQHHSDNIYDQDLVVYTAAIKEDNPEILKARELGIPLMTRSEFLGHLMENFRDSVGISGTHGKTSTTSMLSSVAMTAGLDPTVLVGAHVPVFDSNFRVGRTEVMVVESCEYKKSFLDFPPRIAVILNIEEDHVDCYKNLDEVKSAFRTYAQSVPENGLIVANADDTAVMEAVCDVYAKVITFGVEKGAFRAKNLSVNEEGIYNFDLYEGEVFRFNVPMPVPGLFNIYNALAAMVTAMILGASDDKIREGIIRYSGVDRRLQELGTIKGVRFIDDYGHHPTEVRNAIEAVKKFRHKKLIVVEQPHTFSRLNHFFSEFTESFDDADTLILLPVFAAREADTGLTSSEKLGKAIKTRGTVKTVNVASYEEAAQYIADNSSEGDIVLLVGAGEGYKVFDILKEDERIKEKELAGI